MKKKIFMAVIAFALVLCTSIAFVGCNSNQTPTQNYYSVTAFAGEGGEVYYSADGGNEIIEGGSTVLYAKPSKGYRFDRWSDGNTEQRRTVNNVREDIRFEAYFKPIVRFAYAEVFLVGPSLDGANYIGAENFSMFLEGNTFLNSIATTDTTAANRAIPVEQAYGGLSLPLFILYPTSNHEFDLGSKLNIEFDGTIFFTKNQNVLFDLVPTPGDNDSLEVVVKKVGNGGPVSVTYTEKMDDGVERGIRIRFYFY